jgi:hypothetical protein
MAQKKSIYIGDKMAETLGPCGDGEFLSLSGRINQVTERYAETLRRAGLPEFSEAETNLLRDSLNGVLHDSADSVRGVWMGIEDSINLDGLDKKWEIDGPALVEKLKTLRYDQDLALIEAIEQWWRAKK